MFREYSPAQGRWVRPDPAGLAAVSMTNPQSWNRYVYVSNRPSEATDPLGLCDVVGAGLTNDSLDEGNVQIEEFASEIGANVVYPFANVGVAGGVLSVEAMAIGFDTGGKEAFTTAIWHAWVDKAPINIFGWSGSGQAIFSVLNDLPAEVRNRINNIVLVSPGMGPLPIFGQERAFKPGGVFEAQIYTGNGILESIVSGQFDDISQSTGCGHNSNCAFGALRPVIRKFAGSPCKEPKTFRAEKFNTPRFFLIPDMIIGDVWGFGSILRGTFEVVWHNIYY